MTDVRPSPAAQTRAPVTPKQAGIGAVALLALSLVVTAIKPDEGKVNVATRDFAQGVPTECFGHTAPDVKLGERKTDGQCDVLLTADVRSTIAAVSACTPTIADRPQQLAAATRLAFNVGPAAYCHSDSASAFKRGDWRGGCDLMLAWDKARVGGKLASVPGLAARRQRERTMCLARV
ncbi:MAG: glycoside hydrolase family protein [Janthinobacterium lividum]